jgi:hypothetical protein
MKKPAMSTGYGKKAPGAEIFFLDGQKNCCVLGKKGYTVSHGERNSEVTRPGIPKLGNLVKIESGPASVTGDRNEGRKSDLSHWPESREGAHEG